MNDVSEPERLPPPLANAEARRIFARPAWRLLWEAISALGIRYWGFVAVSIVLGTSALLPPELFRFFTSSLDSVSADFVNDVAVQIALFGVAVVAATFLDSFAQMVLGEWLRLKFEVQLRTRTLQALHNMTIDDTEGAARGEWLTRMSHDLRNVEHFLVESIPSQIRSVTLFVGSLTLFVWTSGTLALLPVGIIIGVCALSIWSQRKLAPHLSHLRDAHGQVFQVLIENLEGKKTLTSLAAEAHVQARFRDILNDLVRRSLAVISRLASINSSTSTVSQALTVVCLVAVLVRYARGGMTLSEALVFPFYLSIFFNSALSIAFSAYDWNRFLLEGDRLADLFARAQHPASTKIVVSPGTGLAAGESASPPFHVAQVPPNAVEIRLTSVEIGYPGRGSLTDPLSFSVLRGQLTLMFGESGSGKSTILDVLAGIRAPLGGAITLHDRQGYLIGKADPTRPLPVEIVAYVEQAPYLFSQSVRANLTLGMRSPISDREIWLALEQVGAAEFLGSRGGLDFELSERGTNLSEGQRYRLALARALLLRRNFLVLDEPFAALDPHAARHVAALLNVLKRDVGILVVSHVRNDVLDIDHEISMGEGGVHGHEALKGSGMASFPGPPGTLATGTISL